MVARARALSLSLSDAAARWASAGDARGADEAFVALCTPAIAAPNGLRPPVAGIGDEELCRYYSSVDAVKGRWTYRATGALDSFLSARRARRQRGEAWGQSVF